MRQGIVCTHRRIERRETILNSFFRPPSLIELNVFIKYAKIDYFTVIKGSKIAKNHILHNFLTFDSEVCTRIGAICVWERWKDALKCLFLKYCGQIPHNNPSGHLHTSCFWPQNLADFRNSTQFSQQRGQQMKPIISKGHSRKVFVFFHRIFF